MQIKTEIFLVMVLCLFGCSCDNGLYGYFDGLPCDTPCYQCIYGQSPEYCYSCLSSDNRYADHYYWVYTHCYCNSGYYDNGQSICPPCSYQCATCTTSSTNCNSCAPNRQSTPTCQCLTKYYDDGASPACQPCSYKCSTCTNAATCLTCNSNNYRQLASTTSYCACMDRYYDNGSSQLCGSCHPTCFECTGTSSTQCTACNPLANRVISGSTCICSGGYYSTSSTLQQCSKCSYSCLTCSGTATSCLTCNTTANRVLTSGACPCKAAYYEDNNYVCQSCQTSCATCSSGYACLTCISTQLTSITSYGLCNCTSTQYWATGTSKCTACNYKCLTCISSATTCRTCASNSFRIYQSSTCACQQYYYDDGVSVICKTCKYTCTTCTAATTCLTCNSAYQRTLTSSQCPCNVGYYDDGANITCKACLYYCLTCSSGASCLTCSSAKYRVINSSTNACVCMPYYYEDPISKLCKACLYNCLSCSNNGTCLTCNSTLLRTLNAATHNCDCSLNFYQSSSFTCLACGPLCVGCLSSSTCIACVANLNRALNISTSTCDCISNYPLNPSNGLCEQCQYHCDSCSTNIQCTSCNGSAHRFINSTTVLCQCLTGYYDDGINELCLTCSYSCLTCTNNSNNCTSCLTSSLRGYTTTGTGTSKTGKCICPQHYFDNIVNYVQNVTCQPCQYGCSTCLSYPNCLTCNSTNYRILDSNNVYCICSIKYFDDGSNQKCIACNYRCQSCTNSTTCLTCSTTSNRDTPSNMCLCSNGFYDTNSSNIICSSCSYTCATCSSASACLTCDNTTYRLLTSGVCFCIGRYYPIVNVATCAPCAISCLTCANSSTACVTCNTTAFRSINTTLNQCPCLSGYYSANVELCVLCDYTCQTCVIGISCTSCNSSAQRSINTTSAKCICNIGYYDNNISQFCVACHPTCLSCVNSNACTSCSSTRNRTLNISADYLGNVDVYCPCLFRYYSLASNSSCSSCHFTCQYCSGPLLSNCLHCNATAKRVYYINPSNSLQQYCKCEGVGYYDTNTTEYCPACDIACATCWNALSTNCFTCDISQQKYFMMVGKNTCYSLCPLYYYNNLTTMACTFCPQYCLQCNYNGTICLLCQSGKFLISGVCFGSCPVNFYRDSVIGSCIACSNGCYNCSSYTLCHSCLTSRYYMDSLTTICSFCNGRCLTCIGPGQNQCLTCAYPLFFKENMCIPLTCPYGQYVDTILGCTNCSSLYEHSLTCTVNAAILCNEPYLLQPSSKTCVNCTSIQGYYLSNITSGSITQQCKEICGDGIKIYYQCDDGNTDNGDGCSENCLLEEGWKCQEDITIKSICTLTSTLTMNVERFTKSKGKNQLTAVISLSLPVKLNQNSMSTVITGLTNDQYSWAINQTTNNLKEVTLSLNYSTNLQDKQLQLSYLDKKTSRLLLTQNERNSETHNENEVNPYKNDDQLLNYLSSPSQSEPNKASRLLVAATFNANIQLSTFPPAIFIADSTSSFYSEIQFIIFILAAIFIALTILLIPFKYSLHSLSLYYICGSIYTCFYLVSYEQTQWIASVLANLNYISFIGGISFGSCCTYNANLQYSTQIFKNSGYVLAVLMGGWLLYALIKSSMKCYLFCVRCFDKDRQQQQQSDGMKKWHKNTKYYIFSVTILLTSNISFASSNALYNYKINSLVDAANITISIFIVLMLCFIMFSLWYITFVSNFYGCVESSQENQSQVVHSSNSKDGDGSVQQKQKKGHRVQHQNSSNIFFAKRSITTVEEIHDKRQEQQLDKSYYLKSSNTSNLNQNTKQSQDGTEGEDNDQIDNRQIVDKNKVHYHRRVHSRQRLFSYGENEEQSKDINNQFQRNNTIGKNKERESLEEMFFEFDFCTEYNNSKPKSKYFLPLLYSKIILSSFCAATLQNYLIEMILINAAMNLILFSFLLVVRPFSSTFTNCRLIFMEGILMAINGTMGYYFYQALSFNYNSTLEMVVVIAFVVVFALGIVFSVIEHFKCWGVGLCRLLEKICCCLCCKFIGKSSQILDVYDVEGKKGEDKMVVEEIVEKNVEDIEIDAFYARILKKKELDTQYRRERRMKQ